ncbi:Uncharacterized protein M6B38_213730 [Iris pallida]|uniref:Uncharacterized protein n=1 Tax=Iris pallida TaxID=29817 RepID=A0AAX6E2A3_IRIPA|nr:Uncharacterized protein M6B38_213730 [Iris pallida]
MQRLRQRSKQWLLNRLKLKPKKMNSPRSHKNLLRMRSSYPLLLRRPLLLPKPLPSIQQKKRRSMSIQVRMSWLLNRLKLNKKKRLPQRQRREMLLMLLKTGKHRGTWEGSCMKMKGR